MTKNNIFVQGSYIDIHHNEVVNIAVDKANVLLQEANMHLQEANVQLQESEKSGSKGGRPKRTEKKSPKPRETMTFQLGKGVLDGHLSLLYNLLSDNECMEGDEVDFKALFSKKMNSNCVLVWTNKYGKGTLVGLFKRLVEEGLIVVPQGFSLTAILEGHFQDSNGKWLTGLDKGNKANKRAAPLIELCVKTLKADPKDLINSMQQEDEYFRSAYDPYDHQDLRLRKHL